MANLISRKNLDTSRKKVLILEDDRWFAEVLVEILGYEYEVKIVPNPEKVFAILDKWWPDIMVADVILGAKNLFVLLNEMQSYIDTRKIEVVILSSVSQQIALSNVTKFNVKKVLDKANITPENLRATLREIVQNSRKNPAETRNSVGAK